MPTIEHHYGCYIIRGREHGREGTLVQTDWDYPGTAQDFGWDMRKVQKRKGRAVHLARYVKGCEHDSTDGTVTCNGCGLTAGDFISAAAEFLDSKCQ